MGERIFLQLAFCDFQVCRWRGIRKVMSMLLILHSEGADHFITV